ncbi:phosphohistidine phosphatase SixA [Thermodesulfovibrionales bacterium]|nr:phosphohistidine phosphatase SixA [Thermodesulfovibrionales bacterium]
MPVKIYLVQHGEAKAETEDPNRPLTDKGRTEVERVASYIARLGVEVSQVWHSGKLRAKQTADIWAQHLMPPQGVSQQEGLGPLDEPGKVKELLLPAKESLLVVGHLPHLSKLVSLLILGKADREVIRFRMGGVVCLARNGDRWLIDWAFTPQLVKK